MFLGLITRCKDEFFIEEFCKYYLNQGIDKIYIIDDNSLNKKIYVNLISNPNIEIIYKKNIFFNLLNQMFEVNKLYKEIKSNFKWIISVDVDEFITTKKNIKNTIREELITTFKNYDCIKIPWVMMSSNDLIYNPKSILNTNIYRWNHNLKHNNSKIQKFRCRYNEIEVKCIFKTEHFNELSIHYPIKPDINVKIINSINLNNDDFNPFYKNLREKDIQNGYLLCYHYRIISIENCINKLNKAQYRKFSLKDLLNSDYSEIIDYTLKDKNDEYNSLDKTKIDCKI